MSSRLPHVLLIVAFAISLAACRQADGPLPVAEGETPNRLGDISRDLASVARGDTQARQDLADDLRVFADQGEEGGRALDDLAMRTAEVISGKDLSDQDAQRLAHHLWLAAAGRELSERQVDSLQNDMQALLVSIGVPEDAATDVATQVESVQQAVTDRQRRWYEFF